MSKIVLIVLIALMQTQNGRATVSQVADTSVPSWMRNAIVYGIKPSGFTDSGSYRSITKKLPEIKELGANVIWLQPVFKTFRGGQGYDIIDFFALRDDLGTAAELKQLIDEAHAMQIKVMFDFVPNHTSVQHPFAKDIVARGVASPYYDYYQHQNDGAPYSSYYHRDSAGFIYYFWKDLVNLNYDNERVQQMIIDACIYWVRNFGIDGYRFDAVWAVNARAPHFMQRLRKELRSLKPDFFMLAEDQGSDSKVFEKGFDAAYDWANDTSWVSHWPWQYQYDAEKNLTVFNHPSVTERVNLLKAALFTPHHNQERILRFMENNDIPRFAATHSRRQTTMAAQLLFALCGIPLIYNGQETGVKSHPYSRRPIFLHSATIRQQDSSGLFDVYKNLIAQRLARPALTSANMEQVPLASGMPAIAFRRWEGDEDIVVVINLDSVPIRAEMSLPASHAVAFTDLLTGKRFRKDANRLLRVPLEGYSVRWLTEKKQRKRRSDMKKP